MARRRPIIVSASRRTDLPGWHAERLAGRLRGLLEERGQEGIYGVVLWTRFPASLLRPPLRSLLEDDLSNLVVNLTLTGLGGSSLEPRAPRMEDVLPVLSELRDLLGGAERIRWRFDPLIPTGDLLGRFSLLAEELVALGVPTCTFAFPSIRSLRGDLVGRYGALNVPQWPHVEARAAFVRRMVAISEPLGLRLLSCSQPEVLGYHPAVGRAQCIPAALLEGGRPEGRPLPRGKDTAQRRHCTCPPSVDLGDYRADTCKSGCLYCYSTLGGPDAGETLPWFLRGR